MEPALVKLIIDTMQGVAAMIFMLVSFHHEHKKDYARAAYWMSFAALMMVCAK